MHRSCAIGQDAEAGCRVSMEEYLPVPLGGVRYRQLCIPLNHDALASLCKTQMTGGDPCDGKLLASLFAKE